MYHRSCPGCGRPNPAKPEINPQLLRLALLDQSLIYVNGDKEPRITDFFGRKVRSFTWNDAHPILAGDDGADEAYGFEYDPVEAEGRDPLNASDESLIYWYVTTLPCYPTCQLFYIIPETVVPAASKLAAISMIIAPPDDLNIYMFLGRGRDGKSWAGQGISLFCQNPEIVGKMSQRLEDKMEKTRLYGGQDQRKLAQILGSF